MEKHNEQALTGSNEAPISHLPDQTADSKHSTTTKGWHFSMAENIPKKIFQIVRSRSRSGTKPETDRERRRSGYLARQASGRANRGHYGGDSVVPPEMVQREAEVHNTQRELAMI